jgi:hypothetical protein
VLSLLLAYDTPFDQRWHGRAPAATIGTAEERPFRDIPLLWRERVHMRFNRWLPHFISFAAIVVGLSLAGALDTAKPPADAIDSPEVAQELAIAERVEHYAPQIDAYRAAVAQFMRLPLSHVAARLLFVEPGIVRSV